MFTFEEFKNVIIGLYVHRKAKTGQRLLLDEDRITILSGSYEITACDIEDCFATFRFYEKALEIFNGKE